MHMQNIDKLENILQMTSNLWNANLKFVIQKCQIKFITSFNLPSKLR